MAPTLPPQSEANRGKPTLILDIDNTLVCRASSCEGYHDIKVEVGSVYYHDIKVDGNVYYLKKRPGVDIFLRQMWPRYEIVYFTSSRERYARPITEKLERDALMHPYMGEQYGAASILLSLNDCDDQYSPRENMMVRVKDLRLLDRDMRRVIWMDDDGEYYPYNRQHGITVPAFTLASTDDRFLFSVTPFFTRLSTMDDFLPEIARYNAGITPDGSSSYLTSDIFLQALLPETTLQEEEVEDKANKEREREVDEANKKSEKEVDEANKKENELDRDNNEANKKSEKEVDEACM